MEKYSIQRQLGSGSFGAAHLAIHNENDQKFVLKEIKISHLNPTELENAKKEVKVLSSLVHNHITKFEESFESDGLLYIVMEYCASGDLQKLIANRKGIYFPENRILDWFTQLCLAVKFIHDRYIIHRDIKTQNIFLSEDGKIKLGDFGIAKTLEKTNDLANTCIGTPYYLSPEMCENKPYSNKSDVWAIGCVLHEMASLKHAFDADNMKALIIKIVKCSYKSLPPQYSRAFRNLVGSIFQRDANSRPSITAILKCKIIFNRLHRFITDSDSDQLLLKNMAKKLWPSISSRRLSVHKQLGLSEPSSKYGISPALKKYGLRSTKSIFSGSKSKAKKKSISPRRSKVKCSAKLGGTLSKRSSKNCSSLAQKKRLLRDHNSNSSSSSQLQLNLGKSSFQSISKHSLDKSALSHFGKECNDFSSSAEANNTSLIKMEQNDFSTYDKKELVNKVSDIVDQEVSQLSQYALEKREAAYSIAKTEFHQNSPSQNVLNLNDIDINMFTPFKTCVVSGNDNESCSRSKWEAPCTPVFARYPLESTAAEMDSTSSSDLVIIHSDNFSLVKSKALPIYNKSLTPFEKSSGIPRNIQFTLLQSLSSLTGTSSFCALELQEKVPKKKMHRSLSLNLSKFSLEEKPNKQLSLSLNCLNEASSNVNLLPLTEVVNSGNKQEVKSAADEGQSNHLVFGESKQSKPRKDSIQKEFIETCTTLSKKDLHNESFEGITTCNSSQLVSACENCISTQIADEGLKPILDDHSQISNTLSTFCDFSTISNNANNDLVSSSSTVINENCDLPSSPSNSSLFDFNVARKSKRNLLKIFQRSSPQSLNSCAIKEEKSFTMTPKSKSKSRFSGIFKRLMSPKLGNKESLNATLDKTEPIKNETYDILRVKNEPLDFTPIKDALDPSMNQSTTYLTFPALNQNFFQLVTTLLVALAILKRTLLLTLVLKVAFILVYLARLQVSLPPVTKVVLPTAILRTHALKEI